MTKRETLLFEIVENEPEIAAWLELGEQELAVGPPPQEEDDDDVPAAA
jgi:hypothetical protein